MIYRGSFKISKAESLSPFKQNKCKLFVLIIKKAGVRALKESFLQMYSFAQSQKKAIKTMNTCCQRNIQAWKVIVWQQIKIYGKNKQSENRIIKNLCTFSKRLQIMAKKRAFDQVQMFSFQSNSQICTKIVSSRNFLLYRLLRKLFLNMKKKSFLKIEQYAKDQNIKKKIVILNIFWKNLQKRRYLQSWSKLLANVGHSTNFVEEKMNQLILQVQDMTIQIQNKNESIERLNGEVRNLKNGQTGYSQGDSMMDSNSRLKSAKKYSQVSDHGSNDGNIKKDDSFGSLLNGSLFSHRSRLTTQTNAKCGCLSKYNTSKNTNITLKKQLQLIKTELAFTKEINQQMESQMKEHMTPEEPEKKIEELEHQLQHLQKDKQNLREKISKYEKYVLKIKMQFKMKIEDIYRRVRRDG